jgi:acyl-CoA synthetase (NDP forming)
VYERALEIVLADTQVDAVVTICTPTFAAPPDQVADVLPRVAAGRGKRVGGCFRAAPATPPLVGGPGDRRSGTGESGGTGPDAVLPDVPTFASPEPAARALARAATYAEWRRRPPGAVPDLAGFDAERAHAVVERALLRSPDGAWLEPDQVDDLLDAAGVPFLHTVAASTPADACRQASGLGYPVALKATGPDIVHKSDEGGVHLDLVDDAALRAAYEEMAGGLGDRMAGAVVQQMAPAGVETIVGVVQDRLFGPLVMFGLGGVATELLKDRAFRVLPLTDLDAAELVRSLGSSPLLFGYRGSPRVAVEALEDVLQRIARLAGRVPEIAEMDLNPVIVSPEGAVAVDCRVRVARVVPGPPNDLRRLG